MMTSLFRIVNGLRYFGLGAKVSRSIYKEPDTYWTITKVKLSKDQNHGTIFGRLVWNGREKPRDQRINTAMKKQWSLVGLPDYAGPKGFKGPRSVKESRSRSP